jgi:hypothetical protein
LSFGNHKRRIPMVLSNASGLSQSISLAYPFFCTA